METNPSTPPRWAWLLCGGALLAYSGVFACFSDQFTYGSPMRERPIIPLTVIMILAAVVYFVAVWIALRSTHDRKLAWAIFAVGAAMRLTMAVSSPILEDDYYRYLWDGAVTAHGHNPYGVIPEAVQVRDENIPPALRDLGREANVILDRVNHPQLGTVYPPIAQAVFALAHAIAPWHLSGLRTLYYLLDCATFGLLILLLRSLRKSPLLVLIYWWNPLAIKEVYNSVHMDVILIPLVLLALLLVRKKQVVWAMLPLALAVATKLWPVLLLPPLLATCRRHPRQLVVASLVFLALTALLLSPLIHILSVGNDSGFVAYGTRWEMNDALFMLFPATLEFAGSFVGFELSARAAHRGGRLIAMMIVAAVCLGVSWRTWRIAGRNNMTHPDEIATVWTPWCHGLLWVTATLFLVSPTQFPWYFLWLLPLLVLTPNRALLSLTLLLPLYYLRFYFDARGAVDFFHYRIVWLEYAPVWTLLLLDARSRLRNIPPALSES